MASPVFSLSPDTANPPRSSTILITGGASGIGLATSLYLHRPEYSNNIVVLDRAALPLSVAELTKSSRYLYIKCDIASWSSQLAAFERAEIRFGSIDHVFVNAGVSEQGDQIFTDEFDNNGRLKEPNRTTIDINLRAVGDTLKLAMYHLRNDTDAKTSKRKGSGRGKGGSVVMTASIAGYISSVGAPMYSAAKHGVIGHLRALKSDCAKVGIAISAVAPGITITPFGMAMHKGIAPEDWGQVIAKQGVPINAPETIALLVGHAMGLGSKANGNGYLVQSNRIQELEGGIATSRAQWMGKEMLELYRGGRGVPLFPNKL